MIVLPDGCFLVQDRAQEERGRLSKTRFSGDPDETVYVHRDTNVGSIQWHMIPFKVNTNVCVSSLTSNESIERCFRVNSSYPYAVWARTPRRFPRHHARRPPPLPPLPPPLLHVTPRDRPPRPPRTQRGNPLHDIQAFRRGLARSIAHFASRFQIHPSCAPLASPQSFSGTISMPGDRLTSPSGTLGTVCDDKPAHCAPARRAASRLPPPRPG